MGNFFEALVPIMAIAFVFGIPILAILTSHQRKMAELMRSQSGNPQAQQEAQALRYEVAQLRDLVNQQQIQLDTLQMQMRSAPMASPRAEDVLGERQQHNF